MLFRNRELRLFAAAYVAVAVACAAGGAALLGSVAAGLWTLGAACALGVVVAGFTWARYRAVAALSATLDAALSGERSLRFSTMREGELAVLASSIDKLFAQLVREGDELERERRRLSDALADISHQLKTPLTSLALVVELLERDAVRELDCAAGAVARDNAGAAAVSAAPLGENVAGTDAGAPLAGDASRVAAQAAEKRLERLRRAEVLVDRIRWLVQALLKLARIDAGIVTFERAEVRAADVVAAALEPLAVAFEAADVAVACDIDPGASFAGDAPWTAEALENVLKNCLEHTPAGGSVRIAAHEDALACRIAVEDTGPGIAPEDLPHVFERFYRGRADRASSSEVNPAGVGIGLALARELVAAQGGALTACNAPAGGARFDLAFFKTPV